MDCVLFEWLNEINNISKFILIEKDSEDEIILKQCIMRCTREILYDVIRFFDNIVDTSKLQAIGIVSYAISYKYMSQYDFESFPGYEWLSCTTDYEHDMKYLILLESAILKMNDWVPCKKVYNRLKKKEELAY